MIDIMSISHLGSDENAFANANVDIFEFHSTFCKVIFQWFKCLHVDELVSFSSRLTHLQTT